MVKIQSTEITFNLTGRHDAMISNDVAVEAGFVCKKVPVLIDTIKGHAVFCITDN
jgi:hypothetical protein